MFGGVSGRLFQDGSIRAQAATGTAPLADQNLVLASLSGQASSGLRIYRRAPAPLHRRAVTT